MSVCLLFLSCIRPHTSCFFFFFFNDTATTEIYTLSLHDALPISLIIDAKVRSDGYVLGTEDRKFLEYAGNHGSELLRQGDRKSTRLNSSHLVISYAVFCLKKKKKIQ